MAGMPSLSLWHRPVQCGLLLGEPCRLGKLMDRMRPARDGCRLFEGAHQTRGGRCESSGGKPRRREIAQRPGSGAIPGRQRSKTGSHGFSATGPTCSCERDPGEWLAGESAAAVAGWSLGSFFQQGKCPGIDELSFFQIVLSQVSLLL